MCLLAVSVSVVACTTPTEMVPGTGDHGCGCGDGPCTDSQCVVLWSVLHGMMHTPTCHMDHDQIHRTLDAVLTPDITRDLEVLVCRGG